MNATATELRGLALLDAAIAQIEAHPETWNQEVYRCKTGMCIAGWTAQIAGGQWLSSNPGNPGDYDPDRHLLVAVPEDNPAFVYRYCSKTVIDADARAIRLLGITDEQADALFDGANNLDDIRRARAVIAAGAAA